ncbi:cytochrome c oxidase subunit II [Tundrisphaera lichenicola]|uniref:cytochrome c oxidase subunit II n=1 Tax=Tundrisphaera lichenicola TaxID=2029860 RepID=UPI003EBEED43
MWDLPLFPERGSTLAGRVDLVFFTVLAIAVVLTAVIGFLVMFLAIRYRKGSQADRSHAFSSNLKLELAWIGIPLVIVLFIFAIGTQVFFEMFNPPKGASPIYVIGKQWMWKVQHPQGRSEINEIHLPLGRPVRLIMTSQDVIHSFFIPAFRIKQDVLPGRLTSEWFEPSKVGRYHLFCAEYCGTEHSRMGGWAVVMEPAAYEEWLKGAPDGSGGKSSDAGVSMASSGARLFEKYHCTGCHGENSKFRAPKLDGVYDGQVPIMAANGKDVEFVKADDMYMRDSILLPKSKVVAGFDPVMPSYKEVLKEEELLQILEYLKSIGRKEGLR